MAWKTASKDMTILTVHNYYRFRGGEDRCADTLRRTLTERGRRVVSFTRDSLDISGFGRWERLSIPMRFHRSHDVERALEELADREKPDIAIVHNVFPLIGMSAFRTLKKRGIPVIKRIENYRFLCLNGLFLRRGVGVCDVCGGGNLWPGIFHRCYQDSLINSAGMAAPLMWTGWRRELFSTVDCFWAPSRFVRDMYIKAGFPAERMAVLPNFLDFEPLEFPPYFSGGGGYAVYIGRLSPEKGVMTLLKAMEGLPGLSLKIVGEGPQTGELQAYAAQKGLTGVEFTGYLDGERKREILANAAFLVFPSECYESFGLTIIEGFACGVPVVTSGMGGAAELATEGETGILFRPGDAADLREKMRMLAESPEKLQQMRKNVQTLVRGRFTADAVYQKLERLMETVKNRNFGK